MVDLTTTYAGVQLKNPIIVASGPTTAIPENCARAAKAGWAGVVLKTVPSDDCGEHIELVKVARPQYFVTDPSGSRRWKPTPPRKTDRRSRDGKKLGKIPSDYAMVMAAPITARGGHANILSYFRPDRYGEYINRTKKLLRGTDCKVIASIYSYTEDGWKQLCDVVNQSDADIVELNLGCAYAGTVHPETGEWHGEGLGIYPELIAKWTTYCKEHITKPIATKLPPHCPDLIASTRACQESGSLGIQYADGDVFRDYPVRPVFLDPETAQVGFIPGLPWATVVIGTVALPYILGGITMMRRRGGINIDISGCSGIRDHLDIVRYLMCGATSAQVCVSTMVEGVGVGAEYLEGLTAWMQRKGYKSIREIVGLVANDSSKFRVDPEKWMPIEVPRVVGGPPSSLRIALDEKRCINCGWCQECCPHLAIAIPDTIPVVDEALCEVCGLCVGVCPMQALSTAPQSQRSSIQSV